MKTQNSSFTFYATSHAYVNTKFNIYNGFFFSYIFRCRKLKSCDPVGDPSLLIEKAFECMNVKLTG